MTALYLLAAVLLIGAVAMLAVGRLGELPPTEPDRAPLALPDDRPLVADDVDAVRFAVGARGYRMDEVDDVLDRLAADISERDARIADLENRLYGRGYPHPGAHAVGAPPRPPAPVQPAPPAAPPAPSAAPPAAPWPQPPAAPAPGYAPQDGVPPTS